MTLTFDLSSLSKTDTSCRGDGGGTATVSGSFGSFFTIPLKLKSKNGADVGSEPQSV